MAAPKIRPATKRNNPSLSDLLNYGWALFGGTGDSVYASATTFTMTGDLTAYFTRGRRLRIYHASAAAYKYVTVVSSSFSVATTTVTVSGNTLLSQTYSSIWLALDPAAYAGELPSGTALSAGDIVYAAADTMLTRLAKPTVPGVLANDATGIPQWITTGWLPMGVTLTYSSVDNPTGVVTSSVDLSSILSLGTRLRFVNNGNTIYGIITAISGTTITFLHEIDTATPTQALTIMTNAAITLPFFSYYKVPYGFPVDPRKWTVRVIDSSDRTQATPTTDVWYNLGTIGITLPIGGWNVSWRAMHAIIHNATPANWHVRTTLSTANNSESDTQLSAVTNNSSLLENKGTVSARKFLTVTVKTPYFLNTASIAGGPTSIKLLNSSGHPAVLEATCGYL